MNSLTLTRNRAGVASESIAKKATPAEAATWEQKHQERIERLGSATRAALAEVVAMEVEDQFEHSSGRTFVMESDIEDWCSQVGVDKKDRRRALDDLHLEGWFVVGSCDCGITIERP